MVGYLIALVLVLVLASLLKETRHEQPLRGILWFGVGMIALSVVVILFIGLHRAATTFDKAPNRFEIHNQRDDRRAMEITEVNIVPVDEGRLRASVSITFDDCFEIDGLKLIRERRAMSF